MKNQLSFICALAGVMTLSGCATATLDVTVDIFEKNPAVDLPLSDRKVEAMLQDLAKLQENADETLATRIKLATGTSALYDDALKMLIKADRLKADDVSYPAQVSCPKLSDDKKVDSNLKPLEKYNSCLSESYEDFKNASNEAYDGLLTYLKAYKKAYTEIVRQQCQQLVNSDKDEKREVLREICDNPETFIEYQDKDIQTIRIGDSKPPHRRKSKDIEVLTKHNYLFDKITVTAKFRALNVNGQGEICSPDKDIAFPSKVTKTVTVKTTTKNGKTETVEQIADTYTLNESEICGQTFVDLEVDTLDKVSRVIAAYKQLSHPAIYFNWGNIEFLINKYIEVRPGSAPLWKNFARQLQKKLVALNEEAGVQPATGQRTISRSYDDTSFQGASLNLANELEALRNDLPESASSQAALEGLVKSKSNLNDLIDRLQNAGDPVWRTIVNPMFANQWNTINKQHFKGDGNTSVVVIRDTPTRFRTAQAKNNPTVLAQNQIAISSAVTEAALNVVGGLSGLGKVDFGKDNADDEQPLDAGKNEALALDIDYQKTVIRNLKSELSQLLAEINALPDDADVRKVEKLRQSAKARMSAYATALSLAGSDTNE
ncbi:hypothetical protein [Alteromonas confluentis]|uniref:Imelysin-like domain-containing protein n=1 Tax=Alteromonas confluentis TaxID=1656094 RepID=A0A1E7ZDH6_9ALTE|nr:hypothetical protein [Alteromonas confluentis]OFC71573.1 hypothetical protein BFC18_07510 [Alteromonas confluentis]